MELIAIGIIIAVIIGACLLSLAVYGIIFKKAKDENTQSLSEGSDRSEISDFFTEKFKNEGSEGLNYDHFN